jgi:preprotein translocase subunit SecA
VVIRRKDLISTRQTVGGAPTKGVNAPEIQAEKKPVEVAPELSQHVRADVPLSARPGKGSSLLDVRLGGGGLKRLWDNVQALAGVGDLSALQRADEVVNEARSVEETLQGTSDEGLREKLGALKESVGQMTLEQRRSLGALRRQVNKLVKAGAPGGEIEDLDQRIAALKTEIDGAELKAQDAVMGQVFGVVSETCARQLGKRPYNEQLQAGVLLERGKVVEQYTGEGKTISAIAPAVLSALGGKATHVATSSNYLAERDAEEMAPVYNALDLSVSALLPDGTAVRFDPGQEPRVTDRKEAYRADVVYGTVAQFGFDHLRDSLAKDPATRVQRPPATLLLDEVDSLLIDDARTPLIISGEPQDPNADVRQLIGGMIEDMSLGDDIEFDRAEGWANLSDQGHDAIVKALDLPADTLLADDPDLFRIVDAAVRARSLFTRGIDYVVQEGKVELVGQNGEILKGRRLAAGLHQAIEAREGVTIEAETQTLGQVTVRDYLSLYQRVGGMTGTAETAASLFDEVYGLDVVRVPTHRKLQRTDEPTKLFASIEDKAAAVLADAKAEAAKGRPVLIGCADDRSVEALSLLLQEEGVEHRCLTAKDEAAEAREVVEHGGEAGSITLSTPKGGRGVHFELGGAHGSADDKQAVIDAGGLVVLGFEHNSCERVDNQLRGRAARQGEPGSTRFYASLEDRFFHGTELPGWVKRNPPPPEGISGKVVDTFVEQQSGLGDSRQHAAMKDSAAFDAVFHAHRNRWSEQHDQILHAHPHQAVRGLIGGFVDSLVDEVGSVKDDALFEIYASLAQTIPLAQRDEAPASWRGLSADALKEKIADQLTGRFDDAFGELEPAGVTALRFTLLEIVDDSFTAHLEDLQTRKQGIGWMSLAQKDPKVQFALQAGEAWDQLMDGTRKECLQAVMGALPEVALD